MGYLAGRVAWMTLPSLLVSRHAIIALNSGPRCPAATTHLPSEPSSHRKGSGHFWPSTPTLDWIAARGTVVTGSRLWTGQGRAGQG